MSRARLLLAACLAIALASCLQDDAAVGGKYAQCADHPAGFDASNPAVASTVAAFVPAGVPVSCSDSRAFLVDGHEVWFVYVAYGALQDCPAGCFSSGVCAVYDAGGAFLYSASWIGASESPPDLPPGCPAPPEGGDTRACDPPPPGTAHPLTATPAFEAFVATEGNGRGAWRFCFL